MSSALLRALAAALGPAQAANELRWMRQATTAPYALQHMVDRRVAGEPLQYILGTQPFGPLNLLVRPPVLIPRPETEHWALKLAEAFAPSSNSTPRSLLDLGTGSGCIPLLLCHLWPQGTLRAHAVDISPHALRLAQKNAAICGFPSTSDNSSNQDAPKNTFTTTQANFLAPDFAQHALLNISPSSGFDIITSNPPYIPFDEYLQLPREVKDFEDPKALFGGPTGLEFYHAIARLVSHKDIDILKPNAVVALEVGHDQATRVRRLMHDTGRFRDTEIWLDPWGKQRTVIARM